MKLLIKFLKDRPLTASISIHLLIIFIFIVFNLINSQKGNTLNRPSIDISVEFINYSDNKVILNDDKGNEKKSSTNLHSDHFIDYKNLEVTNNIKDNKQQNTILNAENTDNKEVLTKEIININTNLKPRSNTDDILSLDEIEKNLDLFDFFVKNEKKEKTEENNEISKRDAYIGMIQESIYQKWENNHLDSGLSCTIRISQDRDGYIKGFTVNECDNEKVKKSAIDAIIATEKLPYQDDFSIFENAINILFVSN